MCTSCGRKRAIGADGESNAEKNVGWGGDGACDVLPGLPQKSKRSVDLSDSIHMPKSTSIRLPDSSRRMFSGLTSLFVVGGVGGKVEGSVCRVGEVCGEDVGISMRGGSVGWRGSEFAGRGGADSGRDSGREIGGLVGQICPRVTTIRHTHEHDQFAVAHCPHCPHRPTASTAATAPTADISGPPPPLLPPHLWAMPWL